MANRRCEGTGPRVLPDKHGSRAAGLQISADLLDVLQGQQKRHIGLEGPQLAATSSALHAEVARLAQLALTPTKPGRARASVPDPLGELLARTEVKEER